MAYDHGMRIAVTGGGGFIGGHVRKFAEDLGHEVTSFDKRDGNDILGELGALRGSEAVIHLAGLLGTHEMFGFIEDSVRTNVLGTTRIAQWCADNDANLVTVNVPNVFPSIYNATKIGAQSVVDVMTQDGMLKSSSLTVYNCYGTHHHTENPAKRLPRKFTPTWATAAWNNKPIRIWGDGTHLIDPISTEETARIFVEATQFSHGEVFDAGTGNGFTVTEVAEFFLKVTGSTAGIVYEPMRRGEAKTNVPATGRGWDLLSRKPEFSWDHLASVIEWYKGMDVVE